MSRRKVWISTWTLTYCPPRPSHLSWSSLQSWILFSCLPRTCISPPMLSLSKLNNSYRSATSNYPPSSFLWPPSLPLLPHMPLKLPHLHEGSGCGTEAKHNNYYCVGVELSAHAPPTSYVIKQTLYSQLHFLVIMWFCSTRDHSHKFLIFRHWSHCTFITLL